MKTKNLKSGILALLLVFGLTTCQKEELSFNSGENDHKKIGNLLVRTNIQDESAQRIMLKNELLPLRDQTFGQLKSTEDFSTIDPTKNYAFKLKAEVSSPLFENHTLQATHVTIKDSWAFVTYNTKGPVWLGGLEIFNVSDIKNPVLVSSAIMPMGDVSAVDYHEGKVYFVGATGMYAQMGFASPAFLEVASLDENMNILAVDTILDISSYVGTDVKVYEDQIMVTSGSSGGLLVFDKSSFQLVHQKEYNYARALDANNQHVFLFQGQEGRINKLTPSGFSQSDLFNVGGANTPDSKSELAVNEKYIFAALNEGGLSMLTMEGILKQHIPKPPTPVGSLEENNVTNSVSVNGDLVLIGNGESGVHVGGIIESLNDSIWMMGSMQFSGSASTNFVESKDSVIFVASGLEGLKIISISVDEGIPDDINPTEPCESLMDEISLLFPESIDAREIHEDLFSDTVLLSVYIEEETDLYLTFLDEGAGWKNTFGYYSYPADNPPASVEDLEKYIVFPNVSKLGEGGGLEYGDQVKLSASPFKAGTVVGFYMISQGWKNGTTVDGIYTHYTNTEFNIKKDQQTTMFVTKGCNDLILTFEDVKQSDPWCDHDFNDIILLIKDNPDTTIPNTRISLKGNPVK